jgi:hypothetical protein
MHNYNFACCFVRVLNMVSLTLREEYRERFGEWDTEEDIWV